MSFARFTSSLMLLAALAGCGHAPSPVAVRVQAAALPTVMIAGEERAFGYDLERFNSLPKPAMAAPLAGTDRDLPTQVDNRRYCSPVADQGKLGACTAFALGRGLREYMQHKNGERANALSPLWLYYRERLHMGPQYVARDTGSTLADGAWVLLNQGCATEATWPYQILKFATAPGADADATAFANRIRRPIPLSGLVDVKGAIANGQAVAFGFKAYESLRTVGADGLMPMPKPGERVLGGHAALAVGYDDDQQTLIVRNSWGAKWGDQGYFYMPYEFLQERSNVIDFWTAQL